jgi:hypothetical protein
MNKLLASILCFMFASPAFADGKVASIKEGQKAPFTGFLFDATAYATIEADKHTLIEKFELEKKLLADKCSAEKEFLNKTCASEKETMEKTNSVVLKGKDDEIVRLNKIIEDMRPPNRGLWIGIGAAAGIAVTLSTVYLVKKL